jgi:hypothetical protein
MKAGCAIDIDQLGFGLTASDEARIDLVVSLREQGFADNVVCRTTRT